MRSGGIFVCLLLVDLLSCRPPSDLTPCQSNADCPATHRCDLQRSFCYPGVADPVENTGSCQKLQVLGNYFSEYDNYPIYLHFYKNSQQSWSDNFASTIQNGQVNIQRNYPAALNNADQVEILLDADVDERCGSEDGIWFAYVRDLNQAHCPFIMQINLQDGLEKTSCASFALLSDINGDGCVDRQDIDLMMSEFALQGSDLQSDLDQNGRVDQTDLNQLLRQYCEGDDTCCAGEDAGTPDIDTRMLRGDSNCDGEINGGHDADPETFSDEEALDLYLQDRAAYEQRFPGCPAGNSDVTCDGMINNQDQARMQDCAPQQDCNCL